MDEDFQNWCDGRVNDRQTRLEYATEKGADLDILHWAFVAGYVRGQLSTTGTKK